MNRTFGSRTRGLGRRAFEDDSTGDPADGTEVVPVADVVGIDANLAASEVTQLAQEAEDEAQDVVDAGDAIEEIETVADIAEASIPEGGLTPAAAAMARQAVDGAAEKAGVDPEEIVMPAAESFGSATGSVVMTRRAVEGFRDKAGEVFNMIIDAIKRAIDWLSQHWNSFFQTGEKLVARADAVVKKAEGVKDQKLKADYKIEKPNLAAAITVGGKYDAAAATNVADAIVKYNGQAATIFAAYGSLAGTADGLDDSGKLKPELFAKLYSSFDQICSETSVVKAPDDKTVVKSTKVLPGEKAFGVVVPKEVGADGTAAAEAFAAFSIAMVPTAPETAHDGKLEVLNQEAVIKLAKEVKSIGEAVVAGKGIAENAQKALKATLKTAEGFKDSADKAKAITDDAERKKYQEAVAAVRKIVSKGAKVMQASPASLFSYATSVGNSLLNYADLSLGGLEKAGKDAAPAPAAA